MSLTDGSFGSVIVFKSCPQSAGDELKLHGQLLGRTLELRDKGAGPREVTCLRLQSPGSSQSPISQLSTLSTVPVTSVLPPRLILWKQ